MLLKVFAVIFFLEHHFVIDSFSFSKTLDMLFNNLRVVVGAIYFAVVLKTFGGTNRGRFRFFLFNLRRRIQLSISAANTSSESLPVRFNCRFSSQNSFKFGF